MHSSSAEGHQPMLKKALMDLQKQSEFTRHAENMQIFYIKINITMSFL